MSATIETYDVICLDFLTEDGVSILKQTFAEINGEIVQIGTNSRTAYTNSPSDRNNIINDLEEKYVNAIFAVWGDTPTIEDLPDSLFESTTE